MINIAILMTCFNRKETTLASIKALYEQTLPKNSNFKVFLVDDGSTDGTSFEVKKMFPHTVLLQGNGDLYWCGGTRLAFKEALKENFDFYLWLNDDTILKENAIKSLLNTYNNLIKENYGSELIVIGSTEDVNSGTITYGGVRRYSNLRPLKFKIIEPNKDKPLECDTMNGNLVLIHQSVVKKIGIISDGFVHGMGDFDYGLKARKAGVGIFIAPKTLGYCSRNSIEGTPDDESLSFKKRYKQFVSTKYMPLKQWKIYTKSHAGKLWVLYLFSPYVLFLFRILLKKLKTIFWKNKW
jgi:GT2 family glycosyltransferase